MKLLLRLLSSFIAPVLMCILLPYWIISSEQRGDPQSWVTGSLPQMITGAAITAAGFILLVLAVRLFIRIGNGTIMPWDPTRNLIIASLYGHVRNPMILSTIIIQMGEALLFASPGVALLAVLNFGLNTVYFIVFEEPGLEKRFGAEYLEYKQNVPRWIPRRKPWRPTV